MKKMHGIALLGAALLALAACGSSSDDDGPATTATTEIPSSATGSSAGLSSFAEGQIGATSDSSEPVLVGDATLPLDDTTETSL